MKAATEINKHCGFQSEVWHSVHLHALKMTYHENQSVSASTQNRHFQNDIINDLWGILS